MQSIIEIVKKHLIDNGFDGLVADDCECGCGVDDLRPCDSDFSKCMPAYRDPITNRFRVSRDHFVGEPNQELEKTGDENGISK